jgi:predicted esterase
MNPPPPEAFGPHAGQPVAEIGADIGSAVGALILVHGRGGSAADMLQLAGHLVGRDVACFAPQAAGHSWYPHRFIEPVARNEPFLSSGLSVLDSLVGRLETGGVPDGRIALLGFSQGACLSLECALRQAKKLGCVIGLSGGLIGDAICLPASQSTLSGVKVLLGCSERDPHIPIARVRETKDVFRALGADVTARIYGGSGHGVNQDEMDLAKSMIAKVMPGTS